jgi:hypothetical protein
MFLCNGIRNFDTLNLHSALTVVNIQHETAEQPPPVLVGMLLLQCYIILVYASTSNAFCDPKKKTWV